MIRRGNGVGHHIRSFIHCGNFDELGLILVVQEAVFIGRIVFVVGGYVKCGQAIQIPQRLVGVKGFHRRGNVQLGQSCTVSEAALPDGGHGFGNGDGLQADAVQEGVWLDSGDIGQVDFLQIGAALEGVLSDFGDGIGDGGLGEAAAGEAFGADAGDAVLDDQGLHVLAVVTPRHIVGVCVVHGACAADGQSTACGIIGPCGIFAAFAGCGIRSQCGDRKHGQYHSQYKKPCKQCFLHVLSSFASCKTLPF